MGAIIDLVKDAMAFDRALSNACRFTLGPSEWRELEFDDSASDAGGSQARLQSAARLRQPTPRGQQVGARSSGEDDPIRPAHSAEAGLFKVFTGCPAIQPL